MSGAKTISCLFPLYRSEGFLPHILANIDAHLELDSEIVVSDHHLLDDALKIIESRYKGCDSVICQGGTDECSWVDNINGMIRLASGRYFRIVPHDDSVTGKSTQLLIDALDAKSDAILASGVVHAFTLENVPIPDKNQMNQTEDADSNAWDIEDALSLFWKGRFGGAFKGVIRSEPVKRRNIYIKKTASLINSERAWLFGLALAGRFKYVPDSVFTKRYHDASTHRGWVHTGATVLETANVMLQYCDDLIDNGPVREMARFNVLVNACRRALWMKNPSAPAPDYLGGAFTSELLHQQSISIQASPYGPPVR